MTNDIPEDNRPVMPLEELLVSATVDLGDFNDQRNGWDGAQYDSTSGVLTFRHNPNPDHMSPADLAAGYEDYRETLADFVELGAVVKLVQKIVDEEWTPGSYPTGTEAALDMIAEILDHGRLELHPGPVSAVSRETEDSPESHSGWRAVAEQSVRMSIVSRETENKS